MKTVAKYTESHDRLTLNVKFVNGDHIRLNISRNRASASSKGAANKADLMTLMKAILPAKPAESPVSQMARVKAFLEKFDSVSLAVASIGDL